MRAVLCKDYGPPQTLIVEDIAAPQAKPGEAIVAVKAVGLNFFDTLIIAGKYQVKPPMPFSPGGEIAGILEDGTRVMAYTGYGGARERMTIPRDKLIPIPDGLSFETAAGLTITYGTTLHALRDRAKLQQGETLAVLGASGGVGQAAVEIGKAMGARVIACASSEEKLAFCKSLGAEEIVNYEKADIKEALKTLSGGSGVNVIYDPVGGALSEPALRSIAWGGRFLVIGFAAGDIPKIALNLILLKGCDVKGVFWGAHVEKEPDRHRANMQQLLDWVAAGTIKPHIHKTWPLEKTAEALGAIARREIMGKAIVTIN
jgi:NADPH2:quinone reductase